MPMFWGMTYNAFVSLQKAARSTTFDDIYSALVAANQQWENENIGVRNCPRLLVVGENNSEGERIAFFEFQSYDTCLAYAKSEREFCFSTEENKIWNGEPHLMSR